MPDYAFISFSGIDSIAVNAIIKNAPKMLIREYEYDFAEGETLIAEMKRHIRQCSAFIFMCSAASLQSVWCQFEVRLGELELIRRGISVRVIPLHDGIRIRDLPDWMQSHWNSLGDVRPSVLERRFLSIIDEDVLKKTYFGLSARVDNVRRKVLARTAQTGISPNIFYLTGVESIGRYTTSEYFMRAQFNNNRHSLAPIIIVTDPVSIESLYMKLQTDFYDLSENNEYEKELIAFRNLGYPDMISRIINVLQRISDFQETIYIRSRSGLVGDNGLILDWVRALFHEISKRVSMRLVVISNRQLREQDLIENSSVAQIDVPELSPEDVTALVRATTLENSGKALSPSAPALIAVGGHPVLAKSYATELARYGEVAEEKAWHDITFQQRHLLQEFLDYGSLGENDKKVLSILSWFPRLPASTFNQVCEDLSIDGYGETVTSLIEESLVNYQAGFYAISGPVRLVFRQLHGLGGDDVIGAVRDILESIISKDGINSADAVENVTFLFNISGKQLPAQLVAVASASTLLEAARELYREGREKPGNVEYERCVDLCSAALEVTKEPALVTEIQVVRARAYLRLKKFDIADEIIKVLERDPSRQSVAIRAQYYRFKGDYKAAVPIYTSVIQSGLNTDAVIHEYCICLRETGNFERVQEVIKEYYRRVEKNIYLLDMKSSLEIGAGQFRDAEKTIALMKGIPDRTGAAARKEAIIICKESFDYQKAHTVISSAIDNLDGNRRGTADLYATRCVIATKMGVPDMARADLAVVKSTHRQSDFIAARLSIHILMAEHKNLEALLSFERLPEKTRLDRELRKEILRNLAEDASLLESKRQEYLHQYKGNCSPRLGDYVGLGWRCQGAT